MTQEERQLLFKDLCARLPYKPYLEWDDGRVIELNPISYETIARIYFQSKGNIIRPYLRPMESMTGEEKMYVNELIYDKDSLFLNPIQTWVINECDIDKYIDFCNSKHLDWRDLIPMGLALEAPEGMYE